MGKSGIQRALEKFEGSTSKLAGAVGGNVNRQHVEHWLKVGRVSAEKCPEVAAAVGMLCEELNDRVNWALARRLSVESVKPLTSGEHQGANHA